MNASPVLARKSRRMALAVGTLAVISLVAAACGGGGGASAAAGTSSDKTTASTSASAKVLEAPGLQAAGSSTKKSSKKTKTTSPSRRTGPPTAFRPAASGKIASVSGDVLEVQNAETGQTTVKVTAKTIITATVSVKESDITKGTCISATGTKGAGGSVDATAVAVFAATKGACTRGFSAPGANFPGGGGIFRGRGGTFPRRTTGSRPTGTGPRVTFKRPANFDSASGKVTSKSGTKIHVQAVTITFAKGKVKTKTGPKTVNVSKKTKYTTTEKVAPSHLKVGECVTATGSTNNIGAVSATTLIVTQPTSTGCPLIGFAGGGGFAGFGGRGGAPGSAGSPASGGTV